jgi:hypothetical protein
MRVRIRVLAHAASQDLVSWLGLRRERQADADGAAHEASPLAHRTLAQSEREEDGWWPGRSSGASALLALIVGWGQNPAFDALDGYGATAPRSDRESALASESARVARRPWGKRGRRDD